ncbi:MAG: hypothetical protein OJF49_001111 [Ktedonobacterales bacterium]|nr:MAG: hypothetical protein OJF49_001111 [Ktedonobacterales bacterium]
MLRTLMTKSMTVRMRRMTFVTTHRRKDNDQRYLPCIAR